MAFPLVAAALQLLDDNGDPLSGGKVYVYEPGTTTPKNSYPTAANADAGTSPNTNPVILNAAGRAQIWGQDASSYKIVIKTSAGVTIQTIENIASDTGLRNALANSAQGGSLVAYNADETVKERLDNIAAVDGADLVGFETSVSVKDELEATRNVSNVFPGMWTPPTEPAANGGANDVIDNNSSTLYDDYMALWESLRTDHTDYITRELLGRDESNTYDIYKYVFEPPNPTKTIIISTLMHGFERLAAISAFLFLRHVAEDWKTYPQLAFLRWNIRIVIIPIVNPWGLSQSPTSRYNSNGVDVNRNFDYHWDEWDDTVDGQEKGTAAESEAETQLVKGVLTEYSDAVAYWDLHDLNSTGDDFIGYHPDMILGGKAGHIFQKVAEAFAEPGDTIRNFMTRAPNCFNYATTLGMHSGNPEHQTDGTTSARWSSVATTAAVRWYGNIILESAKLEQIQSECATDPFAIYGYYASGGGGTDPAITSSSYVEIEDFRITRTSPGPGYFKISGSVTGTVTGLSSGAFARVFAVPKIGHAQNVMAAASETRTDNWEAYADIQQGLRHTLPFEAVIPVAGDNATSGEEIIFGLYMKVDSGTFTVGRFQVLAEFVPTGAETKFQYYKATGNGGTGVGAMELVEFPT